MNLKKAISLILTIIMTISIFVPCAIPSSALGGVQVKLNEVMKKYPPVTKQGDPNSVYFTVSGKPSDSYSSKDCYYPDVAKANGYNWDNMWPAYSCCGFVHFVFRYIFGTEFTWEDAATQTTLTIDKSKKESGRISDIEKFFKNCKPGDAILFKRPTTHYAIFISYDANEKRALTYDCGWDQECAVKTLNRKLSSMADYESITRYRAKNYDKIDSQYAVTPEPEWKYNVISGPNGKSVEITGYSENSKSLTIPSSIKGYPVTRIAAKAFKGTSLKSVKLPVSITSIGKEAFADTPLFKNSMKNDAVYIDNYLIYVGCSEETYKVAAGTVLIADEAFNSYTLDEVTIPQSALYISDSAFKNSSVRCIKSYENSAAWEFAIENNYSFVAIDENGDNPYPIMLGDVNFDNKVTVVDAKWVLLEVAKMKLMSGEQKTAADVNCDGKITVVDAKWILQVVAGTRILEDSKEPNAYEATPADA